MDERRRRPRRVEPASRADLHLMADTRGVSEPELHVAIALAHHWSLDTFREHLDEILNRARFQARHRTRHPGRPAKPKFG